MGLVRTVVELLEGTFIGRGLEAEFLDEVMCGDCAVSVADFDGASVRVFDCICLGLALEFLTSRRIGIEGR